MIKEVLKYILIILLAIVVLMAMRQNESNYASIMKTLKELPSGGHEKVIQTASY